MFDNVVIRHELSGAAVPGDVQLDGILNDYVWTQAMNGIAPFSAFH